MKRMILVVAAVAGVASFADRAEARTVEVGKEGADSAALQAAILEAADGDTVLVHPGLYDGFAAAIYSKSIALLSVAGPEETVIQGNDKNAILQIRSKGDNESIVAGFTFQGNAAQRFGGAISVNQSASPVIRDNIFRENSAGIGGAVYISPHCGATIENNLFIGNSARSWGGAIYMQHSEPLIRNNTFVVNEAPRSGSAIGMYDASPRIENNLFLNQGGVTTIHMMTKKCVPVFACNTYWGDQGTFLGGDDGVKLPDTDSRSVDPKLDGSNGYVLTDGSPLQTGSCAKIGRH